MKEILALPCIALGTAAGVGGWAADIGTCPGEVRSLAPDDGVPVVYCEESPGQKDFIDDPGTTEQKVMYGGFALAGIGIVMLAFPRGKGPVSGRRETPPSTL